MYCAQIDTNNICTSVSELAGVCPVNTIELQSYDTSVLGKEWNGTSFVDVPPVPVPDTWLIAVGAFFDRFGALKIPILASSDAGIQAMVKDAQVRKHIDLQRPDLPSMLDYIIAAGFAVDKAAILGTPAAPTELP